MTHADRSIFEIRDSRVLAAMSHPVRRRLLDVLQVEGPSTVSMLAGRTDAAVGNVSHHLKVLAQAGLIEEATDRARDRREHWWRVVATSRRWSTSEMPDDPVSQVVTQAASSLNLEHQVAKTRAWLAQSDAAEPQWLDAAFSSDSWLHLSADELEEVGRQITGLLAQWWSRTVPDDGAERRPVFVFARGMPATP